MCKSNTNTGAKTIYGKREVPSYRQAACCLRFIWKGAQKLSPKSFRYCGPENLLHVIHMPIVEKLLNLGMFMMMLQAVRLKTTCTCSFCISYPLYASHVTKWCISYHMSHNQNATTSLNRSHHHQPLKCMHLHQLAWSTIVKSLNGTQEFKVQGSLPLKS